MKYALDTNTVVAALNGVQPVPARLAAVDAAGILLPAPVIAELYFGARASSRVRENVARVDRLLTFFGLQPFDEAAARRFAEIKADLRKMGRAKSDFDLAIASIALVHGATLITHDAALLDGSVMGLAVEDWLAPESAAPPRS
ncbi:type II toxin-antitoxin system VapC family toxin [Sorangium sp. So ce1389]|uniref:type II toxin-antitoxin system VapC family toxin n=1 Tax=Sorangium sp. So ce1389 TaxID=3133336 RepID=UPI003F616D2A